MFNVALPVLRTNQVLLPGQILAVVLVHLDPVFPLAVLVTVGQKVTLGAALEGDLRGVRFRVYILLKSHGLFFNCLGRVGHNCGPCQIFGIYALKYFF